MTDFVINLSANAGDTYFLILNIQSQHHILDILLCFGITRYWNLTFLTSARYVGLELQKLT